MGVKHRKTRKQKIIADYRHKEYILKNSNISLNNPVLAIPVNENSYFNTHILKDVLKTGALILSIIAGELILFFLLKNHILKIPGIVY